MKLQIKRTSTVENYMLVQFAENGLVEPYSTGTFAGIASECRSLTIIENEQEIIYEICTLTTHGDTRAKLSGTAPQNGGDAFINGSSISSVGSVKIGEIQPKPFPENGDYVDGDLVNVVIHD
jgi:hypothetical protein